MNEVTGGDILIVDDDGARTRYLTNVLSKAGYEVRVAENGADGLAEVRSSPPDLVLLDVVMPGLSGLDVCRCLKQDPLLSKIPVVLLSATVTKSRSQAEGLEAGGDGYLAWPVERRELLARVALALRTASARRAAAGKEPDRMLTGRQREVVALIAMGLTSKEVAQRLDITWRTAETHRAAIMRKLGVHTTAALVAYAWQHGLIDQ